MLASLRSILTRRWPVLLAILAVAGIAWGAKLMLIRAYGSDVPYMDQWDAQAGELYVPWTEHRLAASAFWAPQNEHHVPLTLLTNFGLTLVNRQWDPLLEMSVNAALHAALAAALLALARRQTRGVAFAGVALVVAALFALPFAWENTLMGFQSTFYFLAWAALGFLWLALPAAPLSARWWAGIIVGLAGLGSMSSGFLCAAAALGVVGLRSVWCDRRWTWRDSIAAAVYVAICLVGLQLVNRVPGHEVYRVSSAGQWLHIFCHVLAWPANFWLGAAVVLQLPLVAFFLGRLRARQLDGPDAVLLGLALWCWGQAAAVAYSRGNLSMGDASRYYDLYAIGIALNAIALARGWRGRAANAVVPLRLDQSHGRDARATLVRRGGWHGRLAHVWENLDAKGRRYKVWPVVAVVWVTALTYGLCEQTAQAYRDYLESFPSVRATERRRLADFVRTGDLTALRRDPGELPHNSADALAHFLSHSGVRRLLPVSLRPPLAIQAVATETRGFARTPPDDLPGKPEDAAVWRAELGPAKFVSEPLPADCLRVLRFTFAGSPELPPGIFFLESADGRRTALQIARFRGDRWQTAHLVLPAGGAVRLVAELPAGKHWLAFADPSEMGRGSWYAYNLRKWAGWIFGVSAGVLALAILTLGWNEPVEADTLRATGASLRTAATEARVRLAAGWGKISAWRARVAGWPGPVLIAMGLGLLALALFLRKPDALLNPQLWAEDGSIFLVQNEQYGLGAWFRPYMGYLHVIPRMVAWAAGFAEPRWIPALYAGAAFGICGAVIARCWSPRLELPAKSWLAIPFLLAPHTGEILVVLTNVQWVTALVLVQQTFMRAPATRRGRVLELGLLVLVGLTGPFALVAWPLLAWKAWRHRERFAVAELIVVSLAAAVQAWYLLHEPPLQYPSPTLASIIHGAAVAGQRLFWDCWGSENLALALPGPIWLATALAALGAWVATLRRPPIAPVIWYSISAGFWLMLAAGLVRSRPDTWGLGNLVLGDRYFFVPRVLLGWMLIWLACGATRWRRIAAGIAAVVILGANLPIYRLPPVTDYAWAQQCEAIRRGEPALITIPPDGWFFKYPGRPKR
jgi:hypothetical protein